MDADENTRARALSPRSASPSMTRRCCRRIERCCCACVTYFPLLFVYSITTWAVCVDVSLAATTTSVPWMGPTSGFIALLLFFMLNWSYTTAVFTNPGSTTNGNGYSTLPTRNPPQMTSLTVKSNGEMRYCKKCQARKPDRAHHCSTCHRCVLKMDHHCPWLATCVGLHNYKAFILFLVYTTSFSIWSFFLAATWLVVELNGGGDDGKGNVVDSLWPINYIMVAIIGIVISLVLGGFTSWHLWLAAKGQTTIECLEKTRYVSPLRRGIQQTYNNLQNNLQNVTGGALHMSKYGQQLVDMHANAIPGVTSPEEGEEFRRESRSKSSAGSATDLSRSSPVTSPVPTGTSSNVERHANNGRSSSRERPHHGRASSVEPQQPETKRWTYDEMERHRARARHEEELDEKELVELPHAFDLGARRNLLHLFGPVPCLWALPIMNTTGDGWNWEPSPHWLLARERQVRERAEQRERERQAGWGVPDDGFDEFKAPIDGASRNHASAAPCSPRPEDDHGNRSPTSTAANSGLGPGGPRRPLSKADRVLGRDPNLYTDRPGASVGMRRLNPAGMTVRGRDADDVDDDEEIDLDKYEDSSEEGSGVD